MSGRSLRNISAMRGMRARIPLTFQLMIRSRCSS
jgi:hypothetical protein